MRVGVVLIALAASACGLLAGFEDGHELKPATIVDAGHDAFDGSVDASDGALDGPEAGVLEKASCVGVPETCGPDGDKDCCASAVVPGGTFDRINDSLYPATVSPFMLDIYEVTVGRFRRFVESGAGTRANPPANGAGAHPQNPRTGWDPSFNEFLASTSRELARTLSDCGSYSTWREADFSNERRPINCVTWYEAFAFCVWDGGYLPTQAEFNFAAAGGDSQRVYPWGSGIDATRASYSEGFQTCNGDPGPGCSFRDLIFVGTRPAGNGRWGHADLAGNVREWLADGAGPLVTPCTDCIEATFTDRRSVGGGSFYDEPPVLQTQFRHDDPPRFGREWNGIRCARPLP